jgi:2-polyprenyl-6-methoxyphenol hydroxylase-like FAD-dependent oxidoreductase
VIAGAGLPGLALAAALARQGLDVALADRATVEAPAAATGGLDSRVYAISPGSAAFLRSLGAWDAIPEDRLAPVEAMHIEGDRGALLDFDAYDLDERALAWIVEERVLRAALIDRVRDAGVAIVAPASFASLAWSTDRGTIAFDDGREVAAALVVGADGARSWVRAAAGIVAQPRPYGQTALVANFACERRHGGVARQWFLPDGGVLAWLPLPGERISIVWSRVETAGAHALGRLECVTPAATFPLSFLKLPAVVAHRLALVGDAAHGIHPLAGQGVNLGFGDAEALVAVLADRGPVHDAGAPVLLERYARRRAAPVAAMQAVTDGLARLFGSPLPSVATLRNLGLAAVSKLPPLRAALAQPALR